MGPWRIFDGRPGSDGPPHRSCKRLIRRTGPRNVRAPCLGQGFSHSTNSRVQLGDAIMHDQPNTPTVAPRKILRPRRLALLASVAGLGMAVLIAGPGGY